MKPTQVASVLGLDRVLAVLLAARPLTDDQVTDTGMVPIDWQMTPVPGLEQAAPALVKVVKFV